MSGTNPVGIFLPSSYTSQTGTAYPLAIDGNWAVAQRVIDMFAPHPASPAAMSVVLDAGFITGEGPSGLQSVTEVAAQTVAISTAPSSPNNRIDLIVVDAATGVASIIAGTAASSPSAPAIAAGKKQICQVYVGSGVSSIGATAITDLRAVWHHNVAGINWNMAGGSANAITVAMTPAVASLVDGLILGLRATYANTSATVTFAPNGLIAGNVTRQGGQALLIGDIQPNQELFLRYNLAYTRWELLNPSQANIPWAAAGGTANALTLTNTPPVAALYDGLVVFGRATAANTSATPSLNVDGTGAKTITRQGGQALTIGDIQNLQELIFKCNLANTRWELLTPGIPNIPWAVAGGSANALTLTNAPPVAALYDGLFVSGRAASANTTATPTLNADGTGAKTITMQGGQALAAGSIAQYGEYLFRYNLANTRWEVLNPVSASSIPAYGAVGSYTIKSSTASWTINSTYSLSGLSGTWRCMGDVNSGVYNGGCCGWLNAYTALFLRIS